MRSAVLDASVVLKWFRPEVEGKDEALALWRQHRSGELALSAPHLLPLELLNALGRHWKWAAPSLRSATMMIDDLAISFVVPDLVAVAGWVGRGLSAYDAAYVAVAEQERAPLVTADRRILATAGGVAVRLTGSQGARLSLVSATRRRAGCRPRPTPGTSQPGWQPGGRTLW